MVNFPQRILIILAPFFLGACQMKINDVPLIPKPLEVTYSPGYFTVTEELALHSDFEKNTDNLIKSRLEDILGVDLVVRPEKNTSNRSQSILIKWVQGDSLSEAYELIVNKNEIEIQCSGKFGWMNALSTLEQIISIQKIEAGVGEDIKKRIPCMKIHDAPAFSWRGLMLDCSRTFIPPESIKRYLDRMALYKMNVLHLHLTDDQGWRLEIKQYPKLTEVCSRMDPVYANENNGYYSQEEMQSIIQYAANRNITIVPEIEMPGHSSEVFAAYPELSCRGQQSQIFPFFSGPGVTDDIFCAGKDEVFFFLENVLDEVCALFPSQYIHIGGDEAPKTHWDNCPLCQQRILNEGLSDSHELQSYFIQRVEKMLTVRGKKLIGWDEILEGGLADNAAVMSWRGTQGGIAAARAGHEVVMSPTSNCYFDYSYGTTALEEVYAFNPVPKGLTDKESEYILGAQANFWSHIDRQQAAMERQIFPRIIALSQVLWCVDKPDYQSFADRMEYHYPLLDTLSVNYYHPTKIIVPNDSTDFAAQLNLEGYSFNFHGFKGADFNYQGMACKVVLPERPAPDKPWIWRARFWGHEPQLDTALLNRGFHVLYCDVGNLYGNPVAVDRWNRFYQLVQQAGLAKKGYLEGMSRGGLIIYNWAVANPDKIAGIYADAPVLDGKSWPGGFGTGSGSKADWDRFKNAYQITDLISLEQFSGDPLHQASQIGQLGIPMIHVCGEADKVVPMKENTDPFEKIIKQNGGEIYVIRKPDVGHHPHSLKDPQPILDFFKL